MKSRKPSEAILALWETVQVDEQTFQAHTAGDPDPPGAPIDPKDLPAADRDFEVVGVLGEGGMGLVQLARQTSLRREVAIKTVRETIADSEGTQNLLREARVSGLLEHPNIVPVHALGVGPEGAPMMVMRKIEGISWMEALEDPSQLPGPFQREQPLDAHLQILLQVCNAIQFAHDRGVLHRDIKPENVMLGPHGEVYVVDWGLAVSLGTTGEAGLKLASEINGVAGTVCYMAPEMAAGRGDLIDARTDVYLLGATLHEALTGLPRHQGKSPMACLVAAYESAPAEFPPGVPEELGRICNKATAAEVDDRFDDVVAFRRALSDFIQHRDSHRLQEEASARLRDLKALIDSADSSLESDADLEIHSLFAQCQFGFEQALHVWPHNTRAQNDHQEALLAMIGFEIDQGNLRSARRLLSQIDSPPRDLQDRVDEMQRQADEERQAVERLQALQRALDFHQGSYSRAWLALAMGVIFGATSIVSAVLTGGLAALTWNTLILQIVAILAIYVVMILVARRWLSVNAVTRRVGMAILLTIALAVVIRITAPGMDASITHTLAMEGLLYAGGCMITALFVDRRLLLAGIPFLLIPVGIAVAPELALFVRGAGIFLAGLVLAIVWFYDARQQQTSLPSSS